MKKLYQKFKQKRINRIRSTKGISKKTKSKYSKGRKKRTFLQNNQSSQSFHELTTRSIEYTIQAPANLSFIENTEDVLIFLNEVRKLCYKYKVILIDLKKITNLTNDAIVLILAFTNDQRNTNNCKIAGNYPENENLRTVFKESGIFQTNSDSNARNYIFEKKSKRIDNIVADELITRATTAIFGVRGYCYGVYMALLEAMSNTCSHANPREKAFETWFLTAYHNKKTNSFSFAFIDTGVGIFQSRRMRDLLKSLAFNVGIIDNRIILKEILEGKKLSSTGLHYRGKGLPAIFKGLERNYYSNLKIITNDVKADPGRDEYISLKNKFKGTFLYFELNENNRWAT